MLSHSLAIILENSLQLTLSLGPNASFKMAICDIISKAGSETTPGILFEKRSLYKKLDKALAHDPTA